MLIENGIIDTTSAEYTAFKNFIEGHMIGITEFEAGLKDKMIQRAVFTFLERTNLSEIESIHWNVIARLAEFYFNRHGLVGVETERQGERSVTLTEDIPSELLRSIYRYRVLP